MNVLSLAKVTVEMALSYFEDDDYYAKEQGQEAEVFGNGARELGLSGRLDRDAFENLLWGYSPDGKHELVKSSRRKIPQVELEKTLTQFSRSLDSLSGLGEKQTDYLRSLAGQSLARGDVKNERVVAAIFANKVKNSAAGGSESPIFYLRRAERRELFAKIGAFTRAVDVDAETRAKLKSASKKLVASLSRSSHSAGVDATLSAPKSVSLAVLLGGDKKLLEAHNHAVDYALQQLEERCIFYRPGTGERLPERSKKLVAAKHGTSRAGDPQLHTHCVIFNMTATDSGKWQALHNREIYRQSKLVGCLYQNKLAELAQKMGYEIEITAKDTFELKGYTEPQLKQFSKRRTEVIENTAKIIYEREVGEALRENGYDPKPLAKDSGALFVVQGVREKLTAEGFYVVNERNGMCDVDGFSGENAFVQRKEKIIANEVDQKANRAGVLRDRSIKSNIAMDQLSERWSTEAQNVDLVHHKKDGREFLWGKDTDANFGVLHLAERRAVFKEYDLELATLRRNIGRASFENMLSDLGNQKLTSTIEAPEGNKETIHATLDQIKKEEASLALAVRGKGKFNPIASRAAADEVALVRGYTEGQKEALTTSLCSRDGLHLWVGVAGSGKSYALSDLCTIARSNDIDVAALAPDAASAKVLGDAIGVEVSTVDRHLLGKRVPAKNSLVIVDEAGKLSTNQLYALQKRVENAGARLLLVGDTRQFSSVNAGNPFLALSRLKGLQKAELSEHNRQKNPVLREAVERASQTSAEDVQGSLSLLKPGVIERKTRLSRLNQVVKGFMALSSENREKTVLLCDRNSDRDELTGILRKKLKETGSLGKNEVTLTILRDKGLTRAGSRLAHNFSKGDVVVLHRDADGLGLNRNEQYHVSDVKKGRVTLQNGEKKVTVSPRELDSFSLFRVDRLRVSQGDKLVWRRNHEGRINREDLTVVGMDKGKLSLRCSFLHKLTPLVSQN